MDVGRKHEMPGSEVKDFMNELIKLLGWHWLIRLCKFQLYNSTMHHLYLHCVPTTQSQIFFYHHIFDPFTHHLPLLPLVTTILLSVSMSFYFSFSKYFKNYYLPLCLHSIFFSISFSWTTWWFDNHVFYKLFPLVSLELNWHHTELLQYCWLYFLCCTLYTQDYLVTTNLYVSICLPFFTQSSKLPPFWQPSVYSLYLHLFLFCLFIVL